MRNQQGWSLVEVIVVTAIASLILTLTITFSAPWIARESMRSAANEVASFMQLAKIEAVSRNRSCRFVVDSASGEIAVWDSRGTAATTDDAKLHGDVLASTVRFARPDTGSALTIESISGGSYQTVFGADGAVASGTGTVYLHGGNDYGGVAVHAAGGIQIQRWTGNRWQVSF